MAEKSLSNKSILNKIGDRFGKLTIIATAKSLDKRNKTAWLCRCDCGIEKVFRQSNLRVGAKSCGCEREIQRLKAITKHGRCNSLTYQTWHAMKQRCTNPNHQNYDSYGGRGITICERWLNSFENFITDMGERPTKGHSIERINPNGGYEPLNCKWVTWKVQSRNKRNTRFATLNNETKSLVEWSEIYKIKFPTLINRLNLGWGIEKALTKPVHKNHADLFKH